MSEINFFLAGIKYLLPSVKLPVVAKLTYLVAHFDGHIIAHLPSVQVVFRVMNKQNPIWSKALIMPLTIWNYVYLTSSLIISKGKLASTSQKIH